MFPLENGTLVIFTSFWGGRRGHTDKSHPRPLEEMNIWPFENGKGDKMEKMFLSLIYQEEDGRTY